MDNQLAREIKTLYTNDEGAERISKKTLLVMVDKMGYHHTEAALGPEWSPRMPSTTLLPPRF
jgi:hypothetical protein